jgi:TetR/AcrR family transcriptional repressor of nem operon
MGHSQDDKARSRRRILAAASRRIRKHGLQNLSIGKLMQSANLTHGGFYGHFASRDALIAEALARALQDGAASAHEAQGDRSFNSRVRSYLSRAHRDAPETGCAIAGLGGEVAREARDVRAVMTPHIANFIDAIERSLTGPASRQRAVAIVSMMVGALTLSRVTEDGALSDEVLRTARQTAMTLAG